MNKYYETRDFFFSEFRGGNGHRGSNPRGKTPRATTTAADNVFSTCLNASRTRRGMSAGRSKNRNIFFFSLSVCYAYPNTWCALHAAERVFAPAITRFTELVCFFIVINANHRAWCVSLCLFRAANGFYGFPNNTHCNQLKRWCSVYTHTQDTRCAESNRRGKRSKKKNVRKTRRLVDDDGDGGNLSKIQKAEKKIIKINKRLIINTVGRAVVDV